MNECPTCGMPVSRIKAQGTKPKRNTEDIESLLEDNADPSNTLYLALSPQRVTALRAAVRLMKG